MLPPSSYEPPLIELDLRSLADDGTSASDSIDSKLHIWLELCIGWGLFGQPFALIFFCAGVSIANALGQCIAGAAAFAFTSSVFAAGAASSIAWWHRAALRTDEFIVGLVPLGILCVESGLLLWLTLG